MAEMYARVILLGDGCVYSQGLQIYGKTVCVGAAAAGGDSHRFYKGVAEDREAGCSGGGPDNRGGCLRINVW